MTTLDGWLMTDRDDEVKLRLASRSDLLDRKHVAVLEIGGVKVPFTVDQCHAAFGDLSHALMALDAKPWDQVVAPAQEPSAA